MMYKDKEKRKAANKAASQRHRDKSKGMTREGMTSHPDSVPELEAIFGPCDKASLQHYIDCPDQYYPRQEPERMNWGKWMNSTQLKQAGLKCNRVAIPGDWDYVSINRMATEVPELAASFKQQTGQNIVEAFV